MRKLGIFAVRDCSHNKCALVCHCH